MMLLLLFLWRFLCQTNNLSRLITFHLVLLPESFIAFEQLSVRKNDYKVFMVMQIHHALSYLNLLKGLCGPVGCTS